MYKSFIFICVYFTSTIVLTNHVNFRCDYKYLDVVDGWMKLHEIPANWHEARLRCHLEGAVLASPLNSNLKFAMSSIMILKTPKQSVFTGIHATFSRGDFFSVEGIPLKKIPHKWAPSEPGNWNDQENCLTMHFDGTLAEKLCSATFNYICYKKRTPDMVVNECGTVDSKYVHYDRTNSCYKFHDVPRTWSRAYMTCAAEGGYLTIINSEKEAGIIREIFAQHLPASMVGNFWKDMAFVGFHDWGEHGTWLTVQGQTLEEAGYAKFAPGEPNNATTGEYCGGVYRTGLLDDIWCENVYAFICEKDPNSLLCDPTSDSFDDIIDIRNVN
uniref:Immulectin-2a n=1 Tax=Manduca sexta TaxID=7130 RepID=C0L7M0_MANSE|nr:immulectin-2a [Manduca sexta]